MSHPNLYNASYIFEFLSFGVNVSMVDWLSFALFLVSWLKNGYLHHLQHFPPIFSHFVRPDELRVCVIYSLPSYQTLPNSWLPKVKGPHLIDSVRFTPCLSDFLLFYLSYLHTIMYKVSARTKVDGAILRVPEVNISSNYFTFKN